MRLIAYPGHSAAKNGGMKVFHDRYGNIAIVGF
jgi:hypothetical protein